MPIYAYEAHTQSGELIADQLAADSVSAALEELEARGLTVRSIRELGEERSTAAQVETPAFYRRVEAALAHRESLIAALEVSADDLSSSRSARELRDLLAELRRGATAQDFIRHESAAAWLPLILRTPALAQSGDAFRQLVTEATRERDNRIMRRRMLFYPVTLLVIALLLALALLLAVVPTFGQMYREFGLRVPLATRVVIGLSDRARETPVLFFASLLLAALGAFGLWSIWVRGAWTTRLIGSWVAGNSLSVTAMARFTGTLSELLTLEAPLPDAIQIAGRASQHAYYRAMADELARSARAGTHELRTTAVARAFPANVIHALEVGQGSGPCIPLLRELSSLYSDRVNQRFDWSSGIIGPLTIVVAGVLVGFFVLALFMPLIQLVSSLT